MDIENYGLKYYAAWNHCAISYKGIPPIHLAVAKSKKKIGLKYSIWIFSQYAGTLY
jgi:hypothetical protein